MILGTVVYDSVGYRNIERVSPLARASPTLPGRDDSPLMAFSTAPAPLGGQSVRSGQRAQAPVVAAAFSAVATR